MTHGRNPVAVETAEEELKTPARAVWVVGHETVTLSGRHIIPSGSRLDPVCAPEPEAAPDGFNVGSGTLYPFTNTAGVKVISAVKPRESGNPRGVLRFPVSPALRDGPRRGKRQSGLRFQVFAAPGKGFQTLPNTLPELAPTTKRPYPRRGHFPKVPLYHTGWRTGQQPRPSNRPVWRF